MGKELKPDIEKLLKVCVENMERVTSQIKQLNLQAQRNSLIIDWIGLQVLEMNEVCGWRIKNSALHLKADNSIDQGQVYETTCGKYYKTSFKGNVCPGCNKKIYDYNNAKFKK